MGKIEDWVLNRRFKKEQDKEQKKVEHQIEEDAYKRERLNVAHRRGIQKARSEGSGSRLQRVNEIFGAINKSAEAGNLLLWGNKKGKSRRKEDDWW